MSPTYAARSASAHGHAEISGRRGPVTTEGVGLLPVERGARAVPAVPPTEHSGYVGRVAALAVALGVGAAMASMPAVASADTTGSGGSAESSSSSSASQAGASPDGSAADSGASDSSVSSVDSSSAADSDDSDSSPDADVAADVAADIDEADVDEADIDEADIDEADIDGDDPADAMPDTQIADGSNTDVAIPVVSDPEDSGSDGDAGVADSQPPLPAASDTTGALDEQTSDEGAGTPASTTMRREIDNADDGSGPAGITAAAPESEPVSAGPETSDASSAAGVHHRDDPMAHHAAAPVESPGAGSAASAEAGSFRLFGDGDATNPNGGFLFGSGFSWDANSCTGTSACHGGSAGLWGGNGGNGYNGGDGGSAGWFGNGGDGGAGVPGGKGGDGGNGGLIFGSGGDGGVGGAALGPGDAPGQGGSGGSGGLFGSNGRAGSVGAPFSNQPPAPVLPSLAFDFIYGTGSQHWSSTARNALEEAAESLSSYFVVTSPVTLTYDVRGENSPFSSTLASASSALSGIGSGFSNTVVQEKIQSGVDANGAAADGQISFNFGRSWGLGNSVGIFQYDFRSTAIHELLHTFGFISNVDSAGSNTSRDWTAFDSFIVNSGNVNVIGADFRWDEAYNANLTGGNGGLYFGGANAVAEHGGLVPLYTPSTWKPGSSVTHADDSTFSGASTLLMNAISSTGQGARTLSPLELSIFEDLGYMVASPQQTSAALFITILLVRRRKTK
ncbi:MAG: hypothetical protein K0U70_14285 [Actinomycetia bacterium]|nr:hypothetical protein [Actinomycetes bacterium]